jgi:hypothetical protein
MARDLVRLMVVEQVAEVTQLMELPPSNYRPMVPLMKNLPTTEFNQPMALALKKRLTAVMEPTVP